MIIEPLLQRRQLNFVPVAKCSRTSLAIGPPLHTAQEDSSFGRMDPIRFSRTLSGNVSFVHVAEFNPTSREEEKSGFIWSVQVKFPFNVTPRCLRVLTRWIVVPSISTLPPLFEFIGRCSLFSALKTIPQVFAHD